MENRRKIALKVGNVYKNLNGSKYLCVSSEENGKATVISQGGWRCDVVNTVMYDNGEIEWGHSFGGYFVPKPNI